MSCWLHLNLFHESSWFCSEIWASKLSGRDLCSLGQLHTAWMALGISRCDQKAEYPGWHTCSMFWMALGICGRVLMHRASSSASSHAQIFCACPMASSENRIGTNGQKKKEGHLIMFNLVAKQPPLPVQIVIFSTRTVESSKSYWVGFPFWPYISWMTIMRTSPRSFSLVSTAHLLQKNLVRMFVACTENLQLPFRAWCVVLRECNVGVFVWHFGSTLPSTGWQWTLTSLLKIISTLSRVLRVHNSILWEKIDINQCMCQLRITPNYGLINIQSPKRRWQPRD